MEPQNQADSDSKFEKLTLSDSEKDVLVATRTLGSFKISFSHALFTLLCATFGAGVIILPFTVIQMGLTGSIIGFVFFLCIKVIAALITARCCQEMMSSVESSKHVRDPLYRLSVMASGRILGRASLVLLVLCQVITVLSYEILIAQTITGILPMNGITNDNQIRLLLCAVAVVIIPLSFLGYLKENRWTVIFGFFSTLLTMLCIITVSFIALLCDALPSAPQPTANFESFVLGAGKIFFAFAGPVIFSPNVSAEIDNVSLMEKAVICCYAILGSLYTIAIFVPSAIFRGLTEDNILLSLGHVDLPSAKVLSLIGQISMLLHFIAGAVVHMNIILQPIEEALKIPIEWSWKRGTFRTAAVIVVTSIGIILPSASILISIAGGITIILLTVGIPAFVYYRLFRTGSFMQMVLLILITVALFEAAASAYSGARSIIEFYSS